jgi:hypothetical protein
MEMNKKEIIDESIAIPKETRDKIFELLEHPLFKHKEFITTGKPTKWGGQPNYRKIARELNINKETTRSYLKDLHKKKREYFQRPEVKQKRKEHHQRPEVKQKRKEYLKEYRQRPKAKQKKKEYNKEYYQKQKLNKEETKNI